MLFTILSENIIKVTSYYKLIFQVDRLKVR